VASLLVEGACSALYWGWFGLAEFSGRTVLVTGGASGIGRKISESFAKAGAKVIVNFNNSEQGALELERQFGCIPFKADVTNSAQVERMKEEVVRQAGGLDVLVNNAGIIEHVKDWRDVTEESWDLLLDTNLKSVFLTCKAFAPLLLNGEYASIVNIASTSFFEGKYPAVHYNASKAGVVALTKTLARQLAPKLRVNAVAPGFIDTNLSKRYSQTQLEGLKSGIPMGRFGTAGEVANAVLFLAGSGASFITGQTLIVDGGRVTF
jgi:3-oxoacyl-[acyl-carrier protein] reductase